MSKQASDKFLVFSIILAALIVAGAFIYASNKNASPSGSTAAPLSPYSEQVIIQSSLQACTQGDTCIVVDTTCSFCCKYVSINAKHEALFNELFDNSCQSFNGAMCECFDLSSYPSCVNGKCQLVQWDEENKP